MLHLKYADEQDIRDKIRVLFAYRKLTRLLEISGLDTDKLFLKRLEDIQYAIYLLDATLEHAWELEKEVLSERWEDIYASMLVLGYEGRRAHRLLKEIRSYERIELNSRKDKWPTREKFVRFYTIKSCDVRLMRHMIYQAAPVLRTDWTEKSWQYYDILTEINDDITDVKEDLHTYNGNRFLISILRKGYHATLDQYEKKLMNLTTKASKYFRRHATEGKNEHLAEWTQQAGEETLDQLHQLKSHTDPSVFSTSWMLQKMK